MRLYRLYWPRNDNNMYNMFASLLFVATNFFFLTLYLFFFITLFLFSYCQFSRRLVVHAGRPDSRKPFQITSTINVFEMVARHLAYSCTRVRKWFDLVMFGLEPKTINNHPNTCLSCLILFELFSTDLKVCAQLTGEIKFYVMRNFF